jgi:hypothetical protein
MNHSERKVCSDGRSRLDALPAPALSAVRAKFHERYRLFFRFFSKEKVIVYAWVNDEATLRKAGSRSDPYAVFRALLKAGNPPGTMAELLAVSARLEAALRSRQQAPARPGKNRPR